MHGRMKVVRAEALRAYILEHDNWQPGQAAKSWDNIADSLRLIMQTPKQPESHRTLAGLNTHQLSQRRRVRLNQFWLNRDKDRHWVSSLLQVGGNKI